MDESMDESIDESIDESNDKSIDKSINKTKTHLNRRTLMILISGQGPFSFCVIMAQFLRPNSIHFTWYMFLLFSELIIIQYIL